jgi:hypothetical protein
MMVDTMPKEIVATLVSEMVETKGWEIVEEYIQKQIDVCVLKLQQNKFSELNEVLVLQERINTLQQLRLRIKNYINQK